MSLHEVRRLSERAYTHARDGEWQEAGRHYAAAGARSLGLKAPGPARRAFEAAGEAFRRADVPREAARCLRVVLTLPSDDHDSAARVRVRLAAVLGELGNGAGAVQLCSLALEEASVEQTRELITDTLIGLLQGYSCKARWRTKVDALGRVAAAFRSGQLARLDGDLPLARRWFRAVADIFEGVAGGEAGAAAAACELAEVDALSGNPGPAVDAYTHAEALHREAGRMSLALRCEAGRIRASVQAGLAVMPASLRAGIELADARGMVLLGIDLRIALGMALAETAPPAAGAALDRAVDDAARLGLRLREGRARWQRAIRLGGVEARADLVAAAMLLEDHVLLCAHVQRL